MALAAVAVQARRHQWAAQGWAPVICRKQTAKRFMQQRWLSLGFTQRSSYVSRSRASRASP
jgi:hypothetical protein